MLGGRAAFVSNLRLLGVATTRNPLMFGEIRPVTVDPGV